MRSREKRKKRVRLDTFPKVLTTVVIIHGIINIDMSYILSMLDKDPVIDVSVALITEIVAPVVVYLATNLIANIFEKNHLSFSSPIRKTEDTEG